MIRLLLINCIHHFLPSKVALGSSSCKQLIEDMQDKTEKNEKKNQNHPLDTMALKMKIGSMEFTLKPRETHGRRSRKGNPHNCVSRRMLKSKGSANIPHDKAPV